MTDRPVSIVDISFWQYGYKDPANGDWTIIKYVDFVKMKTMVDAVIIRAGQNLWKDRAFQVSWENAKDAGIPRGSYWYYDSRAEPKKQAELWVSLLGNDLGELPLWADFEETYGGQYAGWNNWYVFLERIKQLLPNKKIGIYTAFYYWKENAPNPITQAASLNYFKQYPLWIANYDVVKPSIPAPWGNGDWVIWQYTDKGDGPGHGVISQQIDMNHFNGTKEMFASWAGLSEPPIGEEPPDPNTLPKTVRVDSSNGLNARDIPSSITGKILSTFINGQEITITKIVNGLDGNVWGQTSLGWSCLLLKPSKYFTTMKSFDGYTIENYEPPIIVIPPDQESLPKIVTITNTDGLNVRLKPTTQSSITGFNRYNIQITILEIVNGLDGNIWGKVNNGWVCLYYRSTNKYFTSIKDFSVFQIVDYVEPIEEHLYYRLLHDVENPKWGYKSRVITLAQQGLGDIRVAYPETAPFYGGFGTVNLSSKWVNFFDAINTTNASRYIRQQDMGWYNRGSWPTVRQLSWGGNIIEAEKVENGRVYLKNYYYNNENPPSLTGNFYDASIIHYFSVVDRYGNVESSPVGHIRTFAIANNRNEKLWIPLDQVVKVNNLSIYMP